ncbi:FlgB family protein [Paracoccus kondratievae]|uniref:Flagellar biosynthesis protein FlgB n=1 Tax=Paracoccus kondratievae TaxID=135740 RepID=A0AAD3P1G0_9RHOB|nr:MULTISPECIES: FlgB family protein [Paracoccus]QFQ87458.1 FlgB family protein [Paracoccus kondratievae]GLK65404.1 flagellar biosynthesis protein FlgB [Paracoccus kondratievae]SMG52470.1 flagellar basal-body rod protein FlgB [Paracoccus sp. J56]
MFDRIETLRMANSLTAHAAERQKLIARNVANADTPGFRARDLASFTKTYHTQGAVEMRASRPRHLTGASWGGSPRVIDDKGEPAPNGNSVSLEDEMIRSAEARREFDLALAVTKSSLNLIRTSLGRRG